MTPKSWLFSLLVLALPCAALAQNSSMQEHSISGNLGPVDSQAVFASKPMDFQVFATGGFGTVQDDGDSFFHLGARVGKVLALPHGPGVLRGQPEFAIEVMPLWQAYAGTGSGIVPSGTDTFTGVSVVPVNLRWNFTSGHLFVPWVQGAGGVVWTDHKFPNPPADTSVWNFSPQFGIGTHFFFAPKSSFDFGANAVHYSSASLGDHNPGVNAAVEFTVGYSWWH